MKNLIIPFLLFYSFCNSQIKITWIYSKNNPTAEVCIYNNSSENIVLPLDLKSLKPYFENQCSMADYEFPYPIFGLTLSVENKNEKMVGNVHNIEISNNENFSEIIKERENVNNKYLTSLKAWNDKNAFSDLDYAKKNYYLFNNLIVIKSKQKLKFKINVNFENITNEKYIYYYYPIDWTIKNEAKLSLCIDSSIYNYLTEKQKQKFKKYRFFIGRIESNKIELN
ncbi:hypothetical protein BN1195_03943 [Chryseobacterium oranimense G311]|uniref:hypothetical protein n=1 Tax=Chryseobacterium oranimense TaxID=421058 RepID=UPI000533A906|nr:hypothetical protein [Chryseobacterium oranimense]CEJ71594.1 hypothetical protein BN1195_03943 [Chryseobacterium oranimense G311]